MAKKKKMEYSWSSKYEEVDENIGAGGNATVRLVKSIETGEFFALKCLRDYNDKEKRARFIDEITVMSSNYNEVNGIMPIYEWSEEELWYVMPVAKPIIKFFKEEKVDFNQIISVCILYAKELRDMHNRGIVHRDIKPLNLYLLNGKCVFGDFGLADFPESENDFTRSDRGLGAIFTIAPEMKRNPKEADGKKADVFSFAKTMWMFLTLDEKGFDGPYVVDDPEFSLSYLDKYRNVHLVELEELMIDATNTNPEKRPSMEDVYSRLVEFQRILNDFDCAQESDWNYLSRSLFGKYHPRSVQWNETDSIINVLNLIGKRPVYNHMMFSGKGGLDFRFSEKANEKDWIYIYDTTGYCHLVKPKCLYFEDFGEDFTWNYFFLELENANAIEYVPESLEYELLVEDYPGNYVSARYSQYGVYDYESGKKFPEGYKVVHRYLKGKILIVFKRGLYNSISATYDGRHGGFSNEGFREYIGEMIKYEKIAIERNIDPERILNRMFHKNPFAIKEEAEELPRERISGKDEIKTFIEKNIGSWKIELPSFSSNKDAYIAFSFEITTDPQSIFSLFDKKWILTQSGMCIRENIEEEKVYYITSMEEAIKFRDSIEQYISNRIKEAGLIRSEFCSYTSVEMKMLRKPVHLFTYDEMIKKMRLADDRFDNTIIVDGKGEIQIIRDLYYSNLYPVSNGESWNAGNMYVGKYANLDDEKELYMNLLKNWYDYLISGKHQTIGYYESISQSEDELIAMIKEQM